MITTSEKIPESSRPKLATDRIRPTVIGWKGGAATKPVKMVRNHSFLATVREILNWSEASDLTKIGIVGLSGSGKSTLAEAIAHCSHKYSKIPFAVRIFTKEHMMNFKETLSTLTPANYILVFDDISFMGADANKKQVDMIKQAETTIRHLPGGQDVKIILIYNYHYTLGLDKYLRQADFYYYTTIGSQETENMVNFVGKKYTDLIEKFKRYRASAVANKGWIMNIGPKDPFLYRYRDPFIPVLFYNNQSLRFIVTPTRYWIDPICQVCLVGIQSSDVQVGGKNLDAIMKNAEVKFDPSNFKAAVKIKLFVNGLTVYGKKVVRACKYIDKLTTSQNIRLEDIAAYYNFTITKTRLDMKKDDPIYNSVAE